MTALAIFVVAVFAAGDRLGRWLSRAEEQPTGPWERAARAALLGFGVWAAIAWALSFFGALYSLPMQAAALVVLAAAAWLARGAPARAAVAEGAAPAGAKRLFLVVAVGVALTPLVLWFAFVLWRGELMPPYHHDALAYHLPKALYLARAHAFQTFGSPDHRVDGLPANYELMLATVLLFTGTDRITEWIGTATYLALLLGTGALAERWWGRGIHSFAAVLAAAAVPVTLLHSGTQKNDLMAGFFFLMALLWGARYVARPDWPAAAGTLIALALGIGTKPHGFLVAAAVLAPVAVAAWRRRWMTPRRFAGVVALGVSAFAALGGASYLRSLFSDGQVLGGIPLQGDKGGYGEWANLLWYPYLLLSAPFGSRVLEVWVPWRGEYWFWPRYELYFSNYGTLFSYGVAGALALALLARVRGWALPDPARTERRYGLGVGLAAFLLVALLRYEPFGFFSAFPRYTLFVPSVLFAWVVPLAFVGVARLGGWADWGRGGLILLLGIRLAFSAREAAVADRFVPLSTVELVARGILSDRTIPFWPNRAGSVVDELAGPKDRIAMDAAIESWSYPAYGRDLSREVSFVGPGPVVIPEDADWVIVDRAYNKVWYHPEFKDFGQWRKYLSKGPVLPEERRVVEHCLHSPEWVLVFGESGRNQYVFKRAPRAPEKGPVAGD